MAVFTIDPDNNISAFPDAAPQDGNGIESFASQKELAQLAAAWPLSRLVETWNGFAGVAPFDHLQPVNKFTDRHTAVKRIWQAIQKLAPATEVASVAPQGGDGAPGAPASPHPPPRRPRRPKAPKAAYKAAHKAKVTTGKRAQPKQLIVSIPQTRPGSKTAAVLALIQRPQGATLAELRKATAWQPHSVRGFLSGTVGRKLKLPIESSRRADGERVYRVATSGKEA